MKIHHYTSFLTNKKIKLLFNYKSILEDEINFIAKYYKQVPSREDHKNYTFINRKGLF